MFSFHLSEYDQQQDIGIIEKLHENVDFSSLESGRGRKIFFWRKKSGRLHDLLLEFHFLESGRGELNVEFYFFGVRTGFVGAVLEKRGVRTGLPAVSWSPDAAT